MRHTSALARRRWLIPLLIVVLALVVDQVTKALARATLAGQPPILFLGAVARLTYAELWRRAGRVAARLQAAGAGPGARVMVSTPRDATFADRVLFLVDGELAKGTELRGPDLHVDRVHEALAALAI